MKLNTPIITRSPDETWNLARSLVDAFRPPLILALHGDLGAGKTCFVQGLAEAIGIGEAITSPTFTMIREYMTGYCPLYHIDLYRIGDPDELFSFGFEDYLTTNGITAIEWAERAGDLLPENTLHLTFESLSEPDTRKITVRRTAPPPVRQGG